MSWRNVFALEEVPERVSATTGIWQSISAGQWQCWSAQALDVVRAEGYQQTGPYYPVATALMAQKQLLPFLTLVEQQHSRSRRSTEDRSLTIIKRGLSLTLFLFLASTMVVCLVFESLRSPLALAGWCMTTLLLWLVVGYSLVILFLPRSYFVGTGGVRLMQTIGVTSVLLVRIIAIVALLVGAGLIGACFFALSQT